MSGEDEVKVAMSEEEILEAYFAACHTKMEHFAAEPPPDLGSAVIEAAIKYFKSQHDWTESGIVAPFADLYDALWCATDALIASRAEDERDQRLNSEGAIRDAQEVKSRFEAEATGVLEDEVVSEDRERVPREDAIRTDERTKCWQSINRWIRFGDLGVEGNERRNGLILAANEIAMMGVNEGEVAICADETPTADVNMVQEDTL